MILDPPPKLLERPTPPLTLPSPLGLRLGGEEIA
jgi:hypothetical protein